jgi:hypothetical protein
MPVASYVPSGRQLSAPLRILVAIAIAVAVGALGGGSIILFDRIAVSLARGTSSSGGMSFGKLVTFSFIVWLLVFIPLGMGWLCGAGASARSRNPGSAAMTGFGAALLCLAVTVPVVMAGYEMTFSQWLNLSWSTTEGVRSHGSAMALFHLVPIGILLITGAMVAGSRAERPFCEACGEYCDSRAVGEVPGLAGDAPPEVVSDAATYVGRIEAPHPRHEVGEKWGAAALAWCRRCGKVGYLSIEACTIAVEEGGKPKVKKQALATLLALTETQLAGLQGMAEAQGKAAT